MNEHIQNICDSLDYAYRDLAKVNQQIRNNGENLNQASMEYLDKLSHAIKSLETTKAMKEAAEENERGGYGMRGDRGGYGMRRMYYPPSTYPVGGYRDDGMPMDYRDGGYHDGYGRDRDRDSMGRFADGQNMRDKLRAMMANTRDENTRMELQRMMDSMA